MRFLTAVGMTGIIIINRHIKAESLIINSVGHRPTNDIRTKPEALKGRYQGLRPFRACLRGVSFDRALPYPIDFCPFRAFPKTYSQHRNSTFYILHSTFLINISFPLIILFNSRIIIKFGIGNREDVCFF